MASKKEAVHPNPVKDPEDWKTGDEPMTGPQKSYLETLAQEAHEPVGEDLTKAEASEKIDKLREKTGRGTARKKGGARPSSRGGSGRRK